MTSALYLFAISIRELSVGSAIIINLFLVKKKDPLILPPDYENLPSPDEENFVLEEDSIFQDTLDSGEVSPSSKSVESSILKKIQSK